MALILASESNAGGSIAIGPQELDFSNVLIGSQSEAFIAIQHIPDTGPVSGAASTSDSAFSILEGASFTLSGAEGLLVKIRFAPTEARSYAAWATLTTDASSINITRVALVGVGTPPVQNEGAVMVNATLDGAPWEGNIAYAVVGPVHFVGDLVPADYQRRTAGEYKCTVGAGGPTGAYVSNVSATGGGVLAGGGTLHFTINFTSSPVLTSVRITPAAGLGVSLESCTGFLYVLEFTQSLTTPSWVRVGEVQGNDAVASVLGDLRGASGGYCRVTVTQPGGFLHFPLKGLSPYTAEISAVFDHNGPENCPHAEGVLAYTGERGLPDMGRSLWNTPTTSDLCEGAFLYGYAKAALKDKNPFVVNGHYTGGNPVTAEDGWNCPLLLFYEGHTGYDYPVQDGTPVYAAYGDKVQEAGIDPDDAGYHKVVLDHGNEYTTWYLHLTEATVRVGQTVVAGQTQIGTTGGGHLHFTVKKNGRRVDPYGWKGPGRDPYPVEAGGADNVPLWRDVR